MQSRYHPTISSEKVWIGIDFPIDNGGGVVHIVSPIVLNTYTIFSTTFRIFHFKPTGGTKKIPSYC